jgi:ABC-type lipoprotein export system ATPase subunit
MEGIGVNSNNRNNNTISDVNHDRDEAGENTSQSAAGVAISDCDARMERREHQHVRRITADMSVSKDGNNFSAGERQLLALARVFLYNRRIVVMDEPTASIDTGTDERIQPMIRQTFKEGKQTLLCIAHRLTTVIAMDRILVLGVLTDFPCRLQSVLLSSCSLLSQLQLSLVV